MKVRCSQLLFLFILFSCFFCAGSVRAETLVADTEISADTTWTKADSPYVISADVTVDSGSTLTIEPGVIVKFDNSFLNIDGTLLAEGTAVDKIYFTSIKDDSLGGDTNGDGGASNPSESDEGGVALYAGSGSSHLAHASFHYLRDPLYFDSTTLELDTIDIQHCDTAISTYASTLGVTNSTIAHLGFDGIDGYGGSSVTVASTTIEDVGGSALGMYDGSALTLKSSTIKD
ncbi:MAG: right-handed parallel beta-helix repeat-containing protein, partial [Candidatus Pacebacteria bacterium]|nr:right-handed parallel beta-helix repeat-containing protein [Candidatus Paceibacterota bacterium]